MALVSQWQHQKCPNREKKFSSSEPSFRQKTSEKLFSQETLPFLCRVTRIPGVSTTHDLGGIIQSPQVCDTGGKACSLVPYFSLSTKEDHCSCLLWSTPCRANCRQDSHLLLTALRASRLAQNLKPPGLILEVWLLDLSGKPLKGKNAIAFLSSSPFK